MLRVLLNNILFLLVLISRTHGQSLLQDFHFRFENFTVRNGLLTPSVLNITRDANGFVWLYTPSGICRFDGVEFRTYPFPYPSFMSNMFLQEDSAHNLWATDGIFLYLFNPVRDSFERYEMKYPKKSKLVFILDEAGGGQLLFRLVNDIYEMEPYSRGLRLVRKNLPDGVEICNYKDRKGRFWFSGVDQIYCYVPERDSLFATPFEDFQMSGPRVEDGLFALEFANFVLYSRYHKNNTALPGSYIQDSFGLINPVLWPPMTGDSIIWAFNKGYKGLMLFSRNKNKVIGGLCHSKFDYQSLIENRIQNLYVDQEAILWIGTAGGLSMANPARQSIVRIDLPFDPSGLIPVSIQNASNRPIENTALFYNQTELKYIHNKRVRLLPLGKLFCASRDLSRNWISGCYDQQGKLWITSNSGLHRINPDAGIIDYTYMLDDQCASNITGIVADK